MSEPTGDRLTTESAAGVPLDGRTMAEALALSDAERHLSTWLLRHGEVSLDDVAAGLGQAGDAVRDLLGPLVAQGFVRERQGADGVYFRVQLGSSRPRRLSSKLWQNLDDKAGD